MNKQSRRRNVIIKEYGKTWGIKLLIPEQMDGEYTKIPSSISWRHKVSKITKKKMKKVNS